MRSATAINLSWQNAETTRSTEGRTNLNGIRANGGVEHVEGGIAADAEPQCSADEERRQVPIRGYSEQDQPGSASAFLAISRWQSGAGLYKLHADLVGYGSFGHRDGFVCSYQWSEREDKQGAFDCAIGSGAAWALLSDVKHICISGVSRC